MNGVLAPVFVPGPSGKVGHQPRPLPIWIQVTVALLAGLHFCGCITSTYDGLNRLSTMAENGRTTTYGYDLAGNIAAKRYPNGDTETTSFDALNRASVQSGQNGSAVALFTYQYSYDLAGNLGLLVESSVPDPRTVTNTYDGDNRLTQEAVVGSSNVTTVYGYDNAHNRLSKVVTGGTGAGTTNYTYNNLDQLTSYGNGTRSVTLGYDVDGNRNTRTVTGGSDNGTDTYGYDFENRLVSLTKGTAGTGTGTYAYTYDYRTRRVVRDESGAGGVVTDLVFSGGTSVQEYTGTIASANLQVEYLRGSDYGGGVGGILYTLRGGTPSYTHENGRGDVVAKTSTAGSVTYQAQYEAFGNQVATTGSTLDRQRSNSKDTDPTNLVDEGFRYRDLETGMFITRDPAGFIDGPNLYTYVIQNPWTKFDPEGLMTQDQYNQDQAQAQAKLDSHIADLKKGANGKPLRLAGDKETNDLIAEINKDKAGAAEIEKSAHEMSALTQAQVDAHTLDDADQTYKDFRSSEAWSEINPASDIAMYAAQGRGWAATGEFGKDVAESLAIGKLAGLAFKALRLAAPVAKEAPQLFYVQPEFAGEPIGTPITHSLQVLSQGSQSGLNYVVKENGELVIGDRFDELGGHHSDLAGGGPVQAAGEVEFENGQITVLNNGSGHYLPSGPSAQAAAENAFKRAGFDVPSGLYEDFGFK